MKRMIAVLLIISISMIVFFGCSKALNIRPEIVEDLKFYIETFKYARDGNDMTTGREIPDMELLLEETKNLTDDERLAIEKVINLGKNYLMAEMQIEYFSNVKEAKKALDTFDKEYKEIVKYIK